MTFQHKRRQKANIWTDARANLILEVLGAMRVVKYFSYELPFMKRTEIIMIWFPLLTAMFYIGIYDIRAKELKGIRAIQFGRAAK